MAQRATGATPARRARTRRPCLQRGRSSGTQRWNRLRRFERWRDKSTTLRRHDPGKDSEMIIYSPGGATCNAAAGAAVGLFPQPPCQRRRDSTRSPDCPEDQSQQKDYERDDDVILRVHGFREVNIVKTMRRLGRKPDRALQIACPQCTLAPYPIVVPVATKLLPQRFHQYRKSLMPGLLDPFCKHPDCGPESLRRRAPSNSCITSPAFNPSEFESQKLKCIV
jgi:hypothetical protein